jgi:hypothetical protein
MKIDILAYKFEGDNDFFLLEIPKELSELGYEDKVYWFDSMIFSEDLDNPLKGLEKGAYKLECETYDSDLTYEYIKEKAKNFQWFCFDVKNFKKMELKQNIIKLQKKK